MKTVIGVSKKHNSKWRLYGYDYDEDDKLTFQSRRINFLSVWYYKLKKSRTYNDICDNCECEFKFQCTRFEKKPSMCSNCDPDFYDF